MLKFLFIGARAPGRTRAAAQHHLAHVHGRMVVLPPGGAGAMPARYVQNHVIDGAYPPGHGRHAIERDLVTELWFPSIEDLQAAVSTPYYREHLAPDEPRFVDIASVEKLRVEPHTLLEGARERYKLFVLLAEREPFAPPMLGAVAAVLAQDGFTRVVANHVAVPPGASPFADVVIEAWHADPRAILVRIDALPALLAPLREALDPSRAIALIAEEYPAERLREMLGAAS